MPVATVSSLPEPPRTLLSRVPSPPRCCAGFFDRVAMPRNIQRPPTAPAFHRRCRLRLSGLELPTDVRSHPEKRGSVVKRCVYAPEYAKGPVSPFFGERSDRKEG